jgi:hypothetical protein
MTNRASFTTSTENDMFTTQDEGMVPVELNGEHFHLECAQAMGIMDDIRAYHGGEHYATYVMDISTDFEQHEFCCAGCGELFPFVNTGRWS